MKSSVRVPVFVLLATFLPAAPRPQTAQRQFTPLLPFEATSLAVADFDSNGAPDLVSIGSTRSEAAFNDGQGGFGGFASHITFEGVHDLFAGDFNGDGRADILELAPAGVRLRAGFGDGTFANPVLVGGTTPAVGVLALTLDLEHDGDPDLALITSSGALFTLRNDGAGAFTSTLVSTLSLSPRAIAHADLDADGLEDLFVADAISGLVIHFRALAGGAFQLASALTHSARAMTSGDVDGDGDLDLLTLDIGGQQLFRWSNSGTGAWAAGVSTPVISSGVALHAADWNDDGRADVAVAIATGSRTLVRLITNLHTAPFWPSVDTPTGSLAERFYSADFDRDGRLDLIVASASGAEILRSLGDGRFDAPGSTSGGSFAGAVASGDFDGNGSVELAYASATAGLEWSDPSLPVLPTIGTPLAMTRGDFDGDNISDLAIASANQLVQLRLSTAPTQVVGFGTTQPASEVAAGDLDGDGDDDLVFGAGQIGGFPTPTQLIVHTNLGGGLFGPGQTLDMGFAAQSVALADLDLDGRIDVISVGEDSVSKISVRLNTAGGFAPHVLYGTSVLSNELEVADIDADGRVDVITFGSGDNSNVTVRRGLAGGLLATSEKYGFEGDFDSRLASPVLADLDHDGDVDIAVGGVSKRVLVAWNDGNGVFASAEHISAPALIGDSGGIDAFDHDHDGDLDLIAVGSSSPSASFLRNHWVEAPRAFCTPSASPLGCVTLASASGAPSASNVGSCVLGATQVPPQRAGILIYGFATQNAPLAWSSLCVAAPLRRTSVQNSGGSSSSGPCSGSLQFDFNALIASGADPALVAGEVIFAQHYFRSPGAALGGAFSQTLELRIRP